jgi:hypothetical protein
MAISDKDLFHATARLLVALSERFNGQYYDATGELFAWPSREYLMARAAIPSKDTIAKSIKQAEARGYLYVEHGRRRGQRRDVNKYFARMPQGPKNGPWPQGRNLEGRDFELEEKLMSQGPMAERSAIGLKESIIKKRGESLRVEYKEGFQGPKYGPSDSDSDSKKGSRTPEQAALRPEEGKAVSDSDSDSSKKSRTPNEAAARAAAPAARPEEMRNFLRSAGAGLKRVETSAVDGQETERRARGGHR